MSLGLAGRLFVSIPYKWSFPGGSASKESTCNVGDLGSIPRLGRSPGEGNSYPLQYPVLKNSDRGAWWAQSMGSQSVRCSWSDTAERLSLTNGSLLFKANCAAPPSSNIVLSFLALSLLCFQEC